MYKQQWSIAMPRKDAAVMASGSVAPSKTPQARGQQSFDTLSLVVPILARILHLSLMYKLLFDALHTRHCHFFETHPTFLSASCFTAAPVHFLTCCPFASKHSA
jgi:hypothetical protein